MNRIPLLAALLSAALILPAAQASTPAKSAKPAKPAAEAAAPQEKVVYHVNDSSLARIAMRNVENHVNASPDAKIVVVGVCLQQDVSRPLIAINKELNVQYVLGYSIDEFTESLNMIADGTLDVEAMITHRIALEDVPRAFDDLGSPEVQGKVLVQPWA